MLKNLKQNFLFFTLILFLIGCGTVAPRFTAKETKKNVPVEIPIPKENVNSKIPQQKMMDVVLNYLGTPYKFGGATLEGIDCSAFTQVVYDKSIGKKIPRSTGEQFNFGAEIKSNEIEFGDLLFFNNEQSKLSHVGVYIGDNLFAHASESAGVTISSFGSNYYKKRFTGARRIIN